MPSGLRSEVALFVCKPLIMKVPFFKDADDGFVESLVSHLQPEVFLAGEAIVKEGMLAREMYFLIMVGTSRTFPCLRLPKYMCSTQICLSKFLILCAGDSPGHCKRHRDCYL